MTVRLHGPAISVGGQYILTLILHAFNNTGPAGAPCWWCEDAKSKDGSGGCQSSSTVTASTACASQWRGHPSANNLGGAHFMQHCPGVSVWNPIPVDGISHQTLVLILHPDCCSFHSCYAPPVSKAPPQPLPRGLFPRPPRPRQLPLHFKRSTCWPERMVELQISTARSSLRYCTAVRFSNWYLTSLSST